MKTIIEKVFDKVHHNDKEGTCCICGRQYYDYGNNAMPYAKGRCCRDCNDIKVLPLRMFLMGKYNVNYGALKEPIVIRNV